MKLNVEHTKEWIEALRSKKFEQGKNRLKTKTYFGTFHCCLGVACEIAKLGEWTILRQDPDYLAYQIDSEEINSTTLPDKMLDYLGLSQIRQDALVQMNDSDSKSFYDIADQLESWLEEDYKENHEKA